MTNTNPPGGFLDLLNKHRDGRTNVEIAEASGGHVKAPAIGNLVAKGLKQFPSVESIRGYSLALKVPVSTVLEAIAISLDLDPIARASAGDDLVIAHAGRLPAKSRSLLREMGAQMLDWMDAAGDAEAEPRWQDLDLAADEKREEGHDERFQRSLGDDGEGTQEDPHGEG